MVDPVAQFHNVLQSAFGPQELPIMDGKIHRVHVHGDKPGTRNGWYVGHLNAIAFGCFGSWKTAGTWHNWSSHQSAERLEFEQYNEKARMESGGEPAR